MPIERERERDGSIQMTDRQNALDKSTMKFYEEKTHIEKHTNSKQTKLSIICIKIASLHAKWIKLNKEQQQQREKKTNKIICHCVQQSSNFVLTTLLYIYYL